MKELTTIELLKNLDKLATAAPWRYRDCDENIVDSNERVLFPCWQNAMLQQGNDWSDVLLVAKSRNALSKLLDIVDQVRYLKMEKEYGSYDVIELRMEQLFKALAALEEDKP